MQDAVLIQRVSKTDKEFHFQDWVAARIDDTGLIYTPAGRNGYPDFTLVESLVGFEVKGLKWPGREPTYDNNSRIPTGLHGGRDVYFVFGRYPAATKDPQYPVLDLVLCHGDFLNANHDYVHKNKSIRDYGSYGDLLVRDRKMYVAPSPFTLVDGTRGEATLIVPDDLSGDERLDQVGSLVRSEAGRLVVDYTFDLVTNRLTWSFGPNPSAGVQHSFRAYRLKGVGSGGVSLKDAAQVQAELPLEDE